jgi:hypothetical protein
VLHSWWDHGGNASYSMGIVSLIYGNESRMKPLINLTGIDTEAKSGAGARRREERAVQEAQSTNNVAR